MEKSNKTSPHEIYEVLDQQKKLGELKMNIFAVLSKVNAVIDGLAVENLQLTQSDIDNDLKNQDENDNMSDSIEVVNIKQEHKSFNPVEQSNVVNQQMLDIEIKAAFNEDVEIESDEDLDQL